MLTQKPLYLKLLEESQSLRDTGQRSQGRRGQLREVQEPVGGRYLSVVRERTVHGCGDAGRCWPGGAGRPAPHESRGGRQVNDSHPRSESKSDQFVDNLPAEVLVGAREVARRERGEQ